MQEEFLVFLLNGFSAIEYFCTISLRISLKQSGHNYVTNYFWRL